jgi:hypothetical protein
VRDRHDQPERGRVTERSPRADEIRGHDRLAVSRSGRVQRAERDGHAGREKRR